MFSATSTTVYSASRLLPALRHFSNHSAGLRITDLATPGYEKVIRVNHLPSGLDAVISIHSTALGPALGGLRIFDYPSFDAAVMDANRLSAGMSHKSALAGTGLGGGKSVIKVDSKNVTLEMLKAYAAALNILNGSYIAAEDVGSTVRTLDFIGQYSHYVTGCSHSKSSGDPSPFTAWGVYRAMQATCEELDGNSSLQGRTVAIQGLGNVGTKLAEFLFWGGAKLIVSDIDLSRVSAMTKKFSAIPCSPERIHEQPCDIFAPCALGGILNPETIPMLQCGAVTGAANNQLLSPADAGALQDRGIYYTPDFLANAGGIINIGVGGEMSSDGYDPRLSLSVVHKIFDTTKEIFAKAKQSGTTTNKAAIDIAEDRMEKGIGRRTEPVVFHHSNSWT